MSDVKAIADLIGVVNVLADEIKAAKEDGSVDWKDLPKILPIISSAKDALVEISQIPAEIKAMDSAGLLAVVQSLSAAVGSLLSVIL